MAHGPRRNNVLPGMLLLGGAIAIGASTLGAWAKVSGPDIALGNGKIGFHRQCADYTLAKERVIVYQQCADSSYLCFVHTFDAVNTGRSSTVKQLPCGCGS